MLDHRKTRDFCFFSADDGLPSVPGGGGRSQQLGLIDLHLPAQQLKDQLMVRLETLRDRGERIQAQPLGFMRLALGGQLNSADGQFMHIWIPGLPTQRGGPFQHTHVFDLESRILMGTIADITYSIQDNDQGDFVIVDAVCAQDACTPNAGRRRANLLEAETRVFQAGEVYTIPEGVFHQTKPMTDPAVTIMEKRNVRLSNPLLAIPIGTVIPSESFVRDQLDQQWAWDTVLQLVSQVQ